ncbi:MAG: tRNA (adenosine(37)-N6)-threonylcarbamoyltransferase complex dimerization subunit type 1 TsaB [Ornithinimicrobium sp.]
MLLAIDTSTSLVGAACLDAGAVLSEVVERDARRHGELLAPTIAAALEQAGCGPRDLDSVAVGVGPGPFTGLRVGITTALVMARALNVPVVGVCSLDALAWEVHQTLSVADVVGDATPEFLVATDARRKEVYWARYVRQDAQLSRLGAPAVARSADLPRHLRAMPAYGQGTVLYPDDFYAQPDHRDVRPGSVGQCAADASWRMPPEPLYLRRPDAVASAAGPATARVGGPEQASS